jgi:hypothetical protein
MKLAINEFNLKQNGQNGEIIKVPQILRFKA